MQFVPLKNIFWYKSCKTKSFCLSNQKTSEQKTFSGFESSRFRFRVSFWKTCTFRRILSFMDDNVIDLKKKREAKEDAARNEAVQLPEDDFEAHAAPAAFVLEEDTNDGIEWEADEYEKTAKSGYWYGGAAALLFLLVVIGVIARSYFFIAFIIVAAILFAYYSVRAPRRLLFSVTPDGISAGSKFYSYRNLKSFWIFDRNGKAELSLETTSVVNSVVVIPVVGVDLGELRRYLMQYAEEAEHIENFFDRVSRFIGI